MIFNFMPALLALSFRLFDFSPSTHSAEFVFLRSIIYYAYPIVALKPPTSSTYKASHNMVFDEGEIELLYCMVFDKGED